MKLTEQIGATPSADTRSIRKHGPGSYRMTLDSERFAQFVKGRYTSSRKWGDEFRRDPNGRHWAVEIRATDTGELLRFAGVHLSLRDAASEAQDMRAAFPLSATGDATRFVDPASHVVSAGSGHPEHPWCECTPYCCHDSNSAQSSSVSESKR